MGVTGLGSTFSYKYNFKTGKLSTKDGAQDDFVDFFNGTYDGQQIENIPEGLNGYDAEKRGGIRNILELYEEQGLYQDVFDLSKETEYEISGEIVNAEEVTFSVNGEKVLTAYYPLYYTSEEYRQFRGFARQPFETYQHKNYDPSDNSMNIAVGDTIDLRNGYMLRIGTESVEVNCYGRKSAKEEERVNILAQALEAFMHFADQQWDSDMIQQGGVPMLLELLKEFGIDTGREFTVNGTKCEVRNGKIAEVGSTMSFIPAAIYQTARKRQEDLLSRSLSRLYADEMLVPFPEKKS